MIEARSRLLNTIEGTSDLTNNCWKRVFNTAGRAGIIEAASRRDPAAPPCKRSPANTTPDEERQRPLLNFRELHGLMRRFLLYAESLSSGLGKYGRLSHP